MTTKKIIQEASKPVFYTRVAFIALKVAQNVATEDPQTANHVNRIAYANRIFTGAENTLLLAMHIAAINPTIAATLVSDGGDVVPDNDIEFVLGSLWDARANAFAEA